MAGLFDYAGTPGNATVQGGATNTAPNATNSGGVTPTNPLVSGDPLTSILQLITGGLSLGTASSDLNYGKEAAGMADPWSGQRGQYQTALNTFMGNPANAPSAALDPIMKLINNPSSILTAPGYQFGMGQALDAVNRGAGASGLLNSGNRLVALQNQGQAYAGSWLDRMFGEATTATQAGLQAQGQGFNQLARLAGVDAGSPAAAGSLFMQGVQNRGNALTGGTAGVAGGALGILGQLMGLGGGSGGLTGSLKNWWDQNFGNFSGGAGSYNPGDFGGFTTDPSTGLPWLSGGDAPLGDLSSLMGGDGFISDAIAGI